MAVHQVRTEVLQDLGFGVTSYHLESREVLAAMIRRVASYLCPCTNRSLINAVLEPMAHLTEDYDSLEDTLKIVLDELIAIGDIQEHRNIYPNKNYLLYLAPPSFVPLSGGIIAILGIAPDNTSFLPEDIVIKYRKGFRYINKELLHIAVNSQVSLRYINGKVENYTITSSQNHNPSIGLISADSPIAKGILGKMVGDKAEIKTPNGVLAVTITQVKNESNGNGEDELTVHLSQRGLVRLTEEYWLNAPEDESVSSHISKYELLLERIAECTVNPVITILDTSKSVRYYRGRWSDSKSLNGSYIGRRPQLYGNDIWCFSKIENGIVKKFLDLPRESSIGLRGCDEAWRLQAALDAQSGNPQQYRLSKITDKKYSIELFSPIPSWVERRWNWLGERREAKGCLMSFQFTDLEIEQELEFLRRQLWCVACT